MSFVSLYRICQYIEMDFHSTILPPEMNSNAKLSIYGESIYLGLTVVVKCTFIWGIFHILDPQTCFFFLYEYCKTY